MLAPDVYTLAAHGAADPSMVRLADRADQLHLLAFPRGTTSGKFFDSGTYSSAESPHSWTLSINDSVARTVHLQASLQSLEQPFTPCSVTAGGIRLDPSAWRYDPATGVLAVSFASETGTLEVDGC